MWQRERLRVAEFSSWEKARGECAVWEGAETHSEPTGFAGDREIVRHLIQPRGSPQW